jgi:hypothetical protein
MQVVVVLVRQMLEYHRYLQELVVLVEVVLVVYQQVLPAQLIQVAEGLDITDRGVVLATVDQVL